ncbi:MAG: DEAD/DEAH box helicase, partial [Thermoplasmata archaeon]
MSNHFYILIHLLNVLDERIKNAMKKLGLHELTLPQQKAIPEILNGSHCLLIAPTGMGKTEAALLPVFHQFLNSRASNGIKILYVTPLRALNRDMLQRTLQWGKELHIKIAVRHGDTPKQERQRQASKPPDMLITTPETLQILLAGKKLRKALKSVRWLIIDEIHELASNERGMQLAIALERLKEIAGNFQRIGLSATIGNAKEVAKFLGGAEEVKIINVFMEKAMRIDVEYAEDMEVAIEKIEKELKKHESTLIFVNTRDTAELLGAKLIERKNSIEVHHGSLSREARVEAEEKFKNGKIKGLICTSSLELGIDIGRADFIIQFNSPRQVARIIQRVGRSGHRIGKVAKGKIIVSGSIEEYGEACVIAERALENKIEDIKIRKNDLSVLANQIAAMANEYGEIEAKKIYGIVRRAYPYQNLPYDVFIRVIEELKKNGVIWIENELIKKRKKATFYFIENISMIPDERSIDVIDVT